jgi:hypothetical protein
MIGQVRGKTYGGAHIDSYASKLRVDPQDNIIVGAQNICSYLGLASIATLWRWVELYAFPAIKRPDGVWMSSMTAIDQWIFLAAEIVNENTQLSRGLNTTAEIAMARLQRQLDEPGRFEHKRRAAAIRAAKGVGLMPGRKPPRTPYLTSGMARALRAMANNARDRSDG